MENLLYRMVIKDRERIWNIVRGIRKYHEIPDRVPYRVLVAVSFADLNPGMMNPTGETNCGMPFSVSLYYRRRGFVGDMLEFFGLDPGYQVHVVDSTTLTLVNKTDGNNNKIFELTGLGKLPYLPGYIRDGIVEHLMRALSRMRARYQETGAPQPRRVTLKVGNTEYYIYPHGMPPHYPWPSL